ncbi:MAG: hypothetical protein HC890_10215 [Chloroflexaceae bacterium]|nr:hypothetical protein [Chloroflexaceae bacterium]
MKENSRAWLSKTWLVALTLLVMPLAACAGGGQTSNSNPANSRLEIVKIAAP